MMNKETKVEQYILFKIFQQSSTMKRSVLCACVYVCGCVSAIKDVSVISKDGFKGSSNSGKHSETKGKQN